MDAKERRFKALDFLFDYSRGTLWWVKDRLWKEADPTFVVKRKEHPGLSLARRRMTGLQDVVPMLVGTTKNPGHALHVRNLNDPEVRGERVTHFGVLRPHALRFNEFGSADGIVANGYKPRLDRRETALLDRMLSGGR